MVCPTKAPKEDSPLSRGVIDPFKGRMDKCCGDEVFKFPFASLNGARACCGTKTYATEVMECCNNAESDVRSLGSC